MMKFPLLALLAVMLMSTAYAPVAAQKNVAVVSCYVDKYIDVSGLDGAAALAAGIATLAEDERFDLTSVLNTFHDDFFNKYADQFNFNIVPEEEIIGSKKYKTFESKFGESEQDGSRIQDGSIPYEGYQVLIPNALKRENSNKMRMLELFDEETDGVMFITLSFALQPKIAVGGMGTAGVAAYMNITLFDEEGKKVFNFTEYATAKKSIPMIKGVPVLDVDKIKPLCEQAAENLMADMTKKMPKLIKKVAKKF